MCCQDNYIFPFIELNNSDLNIELFGINRLPFHDFCYKKFDPFDYNEIFPNNNENILHVDRCSYINVDALPTQFNELSSNANL